MKSHKTIDEYIANEPPEVQQTLQTVRKRIRELAPDAEETISYGMPAFKLRGKPLAYFAAFKNHCSYFPTSGTVLPTLKKEIEPYKTGKGTLQFPLDKPLSKALIKKLLDARRKEIDKK